MELTDDQIKLSHTIADAEKMRTKVLRASQEIDRIIPDLRHAIDNGRTDAALDLLRTLDAYHLTIGDAVQPTTTDDDVEGCSCGMADRGAPGHDHGPALDSGFASYCNICGRSNGTHSYHCNSDR